MTNNQLYAIGTIDRPRRHHSAVSTNGGPIVTAVELGSPMDARKLFAHDPAGAMLWISAHGRQRLPAGEIAIRAAMLARAMADLGWVTVLGDTSTGRQRRRDAEEARKWVASHSRWWPYAFEPVCEALGLAADRVRRVLLGGG